MYHEENYQFSEGDIVMIQKSVKKEHLHKIGVVVARRNEGEMNVFRVEVKGERLWFETSELSKIS